MDPRQLAALLKWITACADRGDSCPTSTAIGERFGGGPSFAGRMLRRLEDDGDIIVKACVGGAIGRVVTIVATGRSTARPNPITPPRRSRGRTGVCA